MSAGLTPHRWRLTGVGATDDEMRCFAAVTGPGGRTRRYTFVKEIIDEAANFSMWTTGDWDRDTVYDRDAYKAVVDAVIAFHAAHMREIALGDADDRDATPGSAWRLAGIGATEDETRQSAVVRDPHGRTRGYTFAREIVQTGAGDLVTWATGDWDRDTIYDRDAYKAVLDAVIAFHEARQREMALGDDEDRKPPGL